MTAANGWSLAFDGPAVASFASAAALAALAFWLCRRGLPASRPWPRRLLPAARTLAVGLAALMLAQPALRGERTVERRGRVTLLVDASASMSVGDQQMTAGRKLRLARSLDLREADAINFTLADLADAAAAISDLADAAEFAEAAGRLAESLATADPADVAGLDPRGFAVVERWDDVPGHRLADIERDATFDRPPSREGRASSLRFDANEGDDYARRIRGRLRPSVSGHYTMALAADAAAELRIDGSAVVTVAERTVADDFTAARSGPLPFEAGRAYDFEIIHKEGSGDDHLSLAWSADGGPLEVIAGDALAPPAGTLSATQVRDDAAARFRREVVEPARSVGDLPVERRVDGLAPARVAAADWSRQFADAFTARADKEIAAGDERVADAVAAVDALDRAARVDRLIRRPGGLVESLRRTADVEVRPFSAEGTATDLAAALDSLAPSTGVPQAGVLISDGRHNAGATSPTLAAEGLARVGVPVHAVVVGSESPPIDLALAGVISPQSVHADDSVTGSVQLHDTMPPGVDVVMRVTDGRATLWEERLVTTGRGRRDVAFAFPAAAAVADTNKPDLRETLAALAVEVAPVEGEAVATNNALDLPIRITLGRLKVLVIDGRPRWDTRYLATILGRDARWEVTAILGPSAAGRPDSREQLFDYDAVVLGDVPASSWRTDELAWLADFVGERGGGLLIVDGQRGHLRGYSSTPLGPLLPAVQGADATAVKMLRPTPVGAAVDALRIDDSENVAASWASLPQPKRVVGLDLLPGATTLLQAEIENGPAVPVAVERRYGRGLVYHQGFDETWRWRAGGRGESVQGRYWAGVLRRLVEPPFSAEGRAVSVGVESSTVEPGGEVRVRARLRDPTGGPLAAGEVERLSPAAVLARSDGTEVSTAPLTVDDGGLLTATLRAPATPGLYEVRVSAESYSGSDLTTSARVFVRRPAPPAETSQLAADPDAMNRLAQAGGTGRAIVEEQAGAVLPARLSGLSRRDTLVTRIELWAGWPIFSGVIGLLAFEWTVRRTGGL